MSTREEPIDAPGAGGSRALLYLCAACALGAAAIYPFDHALSRLATPLEPEHEPFDTLFRAVKSFGKGDVLCTVLLLACLTRLRKPAVRGLVSLALVALPVIVLKNAVGRVRPSHPGDSFPSGDAASVVAALAPLALASPRLRVPIAIVALLVAAFRVVASYHYPSDVLAGASLGCLTAWASLRWVSGRWLRPRSRLVVPLIVVSVAICVLIAVRSANNSPSQIFLYFLLPVLVIAVVLERRRLARFAPSRSDAR